VYRHVYHRIILGLIPLLQSRSQTQLANSSYASLRRVFLHEPGYICSECFGILLLDDLVFDLEVFGEKSLGTFILEQMRLPRRLPKQKEHFPNFWVSRKSGPNTEIVCSFLLNLICTNIIKRSRFKNVPFAVSEGARERIFEVIRNECLLNKFV